MRGLVPRIHVTRVKSILLPEMAQRRGCSTNRSIARAIFSQ
jgi:hypothetical protein